jgi:hypothetical protein
MDAIDGYCSFSSFLENAIFRFVDTISSKNNVQFVLVRSNITVKCHSPCRFLSSNYSKLKTLWESVNSIMKILQHFLVVFSKITSKIFGRNRTSLFSI